VIGGLLVAASIAGAGLCKKKGACCFREAASEGGQAEGKELFKARIKTDASNNQLKESLV